MPSHGLKTNDMILLNNDIKIQAFTTKDCLLEQKKNEFLASLYEKNFQAAELIFMDILKLAQNQSEFSENFEKRLNQIQTIFKKFKHALFKHCSSEIKKNHACLKKMILASIKHSSDSIGHVNFQTWETKLDLKPCQKNLLFQTAMTFQLTSGCSNFCRRCNEWALPKVRRHFSFNAILTILNHMADQKNDEISLYGASDPLDWTAGDKALPDIIEYLKKLPLEYSLLTKVPKGKRHLLKLLLKNHSNLSVSITSKNKKRIKQIEQEIDTPISKQHDLEELLIPAGLDEDFVSIKPSITDGYGTEITPDGAFIIIPCFTSALYPFGHKKIPVTSNTRFFPVKKTGRQALLVDYFKPLEGYDLNKSLCHLSALLDVQIESVILDNGTEQLTPPGMRSLKEFLSIFEEKARCQRKKMTPSIMKKLKQRFLATTCFKKLSKKNKNLFLKKIAGHLKLCKQKHCVSARLYAVSFFLESIRQYIPTHFINVKIMRFLLKDEIQHIFNLTDTLIADQSLEKVLTDPDVDVFYAFRFYVFCLLTKSDDRAILEFIQTYPAAYDPEADIFVLRSFSN
ncbi:hypothetical protein [Desulfobacula phenolica]|uniref:hypothetical protein n=1 Tax=Desulfobacula phenolica TaxID=90732 RepID=UPI00111443DE|nr:hypothetical protein [Desulfobacula phenolica]